jgi:molybdopterin-biosynthesis enzyme MoeA-like protein
MKKHTNTQKQKNRQLIVSISLFLLGREEMRNLFWNIASATYNGKTQQVEIGISTIDGKLGTTLEKLRKTCKPLSVYLYESKITFRKPHIHFFVQKEDTTEQRVTSIIESLSPGNAA